MSAPSRQRFKNRRSWEEHYLPRLQFFEERFTHARVNTGQEFIKFDKGGLDYLKDETRQVSHKSRKLQKLKMLKWVVFAPVRGFYTPVLKRLPITKNKLAIVFSRYIIPDMALGQKIRNRREQLDLTLDEVAAKTGFSKPYLSTVETGKVKYPPSDKLLNKLEKVLKFEPSELRRLAHIERMPADIRRDYEAIDAENRHYKQILQKIIHRDLKPAQVDKVLAEYDLDIEDPTPSKSNPASSWVPIINKVTAGYPSQFDDMGYPVGFADDFIRCPDIHDLNAFAVRVVGDSMEPQFFEGDIVVFAPGTDVQNGDDCFVRFKSPHETTFKRVFFEADGRIRLQPRNDNYAPLVVPGRRVNGIYRAALHYRTL